MLVFSQSSKAGVDALFSAFRDIHPRIRVGTLHERRSKWRDGSDGEDEGGDNEEL